MEEDDPAPAGLPAALFYSTAVSILLWLPSEETRAQLTGDFLSFHGGAGIQSQQPLAGRLLKSSQSAVSLPFGRGGLRTLCPLSLCCAEGRSSEPDPRGSLGAGIYKRWRSRGRHRAAQRRAIGGPTRRFGSIGTGPEATQRLDQDGEVVDLLKPQSPQGSPSPLWLFTLDF